MLLHIVYYQHVSIAFAIILRVALQEYNKYIGLQAKYPLFLVRPTDMTKLIVVNSNFGTRLKTNKTLVVKNK